MAASQSTRLAIYTWSAGTDTFTRDQMTTSHSNIEARVSGYNQDGSRPAAATAYKGFFHYSSTDSSAGALSYCNGTAWFNIGSLGSTTPTALDGTGAGGSSQDGSRSDHKHAIANDTITNAMIDENAVQSEQIQQDAVTSVKILAGAVTLPKIVDATAGYRIIAKTGNGSGDWAELPAGNDSVLRRDGSGVLEFGTIDTNHIAADAVTNAKLDSTDGSEAVSTNTIQDGAVTTLKLDQTNGSEAVTTATIRANNVTVAEIEQVAAHGILANATSSAANLTEVTAGTNTVLLRGASGSVAFGTVTNDMIGSGISGSKITTGTVDKDYIDAEIARKAVVYGKDGSAPAGHVIYKSTGAPATASDYAEGDIWLEYTS